MVLLLLVVDLGREDADDDDDLLPTTHLFQELFVYDCVR